MGRRLGVLVAVLGLFAAACTGAPRPETLAAKDKKAADRAAAEASESTVEETTTTLAGEAAAAARAGGAGKTATTAKAGTPAQSSTPGVKGADGITPATLFRANEDRIGISDTTIKLCGHAALALASAFNTRPEDINVYWQMVKDRGGIHRRNVDVTYEDDAYDPGLAVQAANACKAKNPFLLLGGIGFDQIPAVRVWADQNRVPYVHHIAVGAGGENKQFSFTSQPTVEQVGTAMGEFIVNKYKGKKIGIVYRNGDNWKPGYENGLDYMTGKGLKIVAKVPVEKNATVYSSQIFELQSQGAEVVWFWENALAGAQFIKQSQAQGYKPTYVVFPFQTTLDVLAEDATQQPIVGVATWPAYKQGGYTGPYAFPGTGYQEEIAAFEAAMRKYRPGVTPNDILWQVWVANKGFEDLLQRCGRDCTRNRFVGILLAYKGTVAPACPVDFPRGGGHRGAFQTYLTQEAFAVGGGAAAFRTTGWCQEHLN